MTDAAKRAIAYLFALTLAMFSPGLGEDAPRLIPLGSIVGRLTSTEKPPALPKKIVVTTLPSRSAAKVRNLPKGEIECPVDGEGRFRCELPAATFDLSIFATSYIPRYAWDVAVPAGGEADLKSFALVRGASLAGWVEVAEGAIDPDRCRVSIAPLAPIVAAGGSDLGAIEKQTRMKRETKVNAHGFFQVVGLPAGAYSISAEQGTAFAEPSGPFEVAAQEETYLPEPFRLVPPLELELVVDPALDPHGKPWSLHVERSVDTASSLTEEVFDGKASAEGLAKVAGQRRGKFSVRISDSTGQRMLSEHDLLIDSEAGARRVFEIHWIAVEGSIRLGDEPLQATLWFGGKSGPTAIRLDSDKEGRFSGALSREGHWRIDLAAESPPVALQLQRVIEAEKGKARLDIEVPDTRIFGRVLAPSGQPEPAALVSVLESDGASQILSADDSGHFELRGVAPGEVSLVAETRQGDLDGDQVILNLAKSAEIGPIELKLQKKTRFAGRVLTSRGGGGSAAVTVMGVRPARFGNDRTRTSADGRFEVRLPSGVESAVALVAALGSSLTAFELRPGPSTDLPVAHLGGTVEVALGAPIARRIAEEDAFLMLFQNGLEIPLNVLSDWSRSHGESSAGGALRLFPALAPGGYSACLVPISALDHGTDFRITVDGMPVNMPSHGHGQGYADLNFLIPELVSTVEYRKGAYDASEGDFSAAGAAHLEYVDQQEKGIAQLTPGSFGYGPALVGDSREVDQERPSSTRSIERGSPPPGRTTSGRYPSRRSSRPWSIGALGCGRSPACGSIPTPPTWTATSKRTPAAGRRLSSRRS